MLRRGSYSGREARRQSPLAITKVTHILAVYLSLNVGKSVVQNDNNNCAVQSCNGETPMEWSPGVS